MSNIVNVLLSFGSDLRTSLLGLIIGYIAYKLTKFYVRVFSLPPGPIPLPFFGNILLFKRSEKHWSLELERVSQRYDSVFTIWMGSEPVVFITDIDVGREAFRKYEFCGRPKDIFGELLCNEKYMDFAFADAGRSWEALRRVTHSASQKYANTQKLVNLVVDCVDDTVDTMIATEGFDKPFVPFDYIYNLFLNVMAATAFDIKYEINDPEYKSIKFVLRDFFVANSSKLAYWEFFPISRKMDEKIFSEFREKLEENLDILKSKYQTHYREYNQSIIRDFCDTLISARNEALRDGKESAPYLTDDNLAMAIFDVFFAGTDTSQTTFRWIFLYLTHNKEVEQKLRHEIESEIGDRMPSHEDRNRCHYVMAFISEVMRIRNIAPQGLQHKTMVTTKLGDYTIPVDTQVIVFQGHILRNEKYWSNSLEFRPERFLDSNGKYLSTKPKAFIPFGVGRRVCLGEKLAIADLFLVLVRFLQKTADYELVLHCTASDPFEPDPNDSIELHPTEYKISFRRK